MAGPGAPFPRPAWNFYGVLCLVASVAIGCYLPVLDNGFVYDDVVTVVRNQDLRPETHWKDVFYHDYWGHDITAVDSHKSYRPLTTLSLRANYHMHGLQPRGYHAVNVVLHAANSALVAAMSHAGLAPHSSLAVPAATIAGLLFAVHPVHVDAVANATGRCELLGALFFLLAMNLFFGSPWRVRRAVLACVLFTIALYCKETAFTGIICVAAQPLLELWPPGRNIKRRTALGAVARGVAVTVWVAVALAMRFRIARASRPHIHPDYNTVAHAPDAVTRRLSIAWTHVVHLGLLLWPRVLSPDWSFNAIPLVTRVMDPRNMATLAAYTSVLAVPAIALRHMSSRPGGSKRARRAEGGMALLAWLSGVAAFIPVANVFYPVGFEVAERVLYMPSIGVALLAGLAAAWAWQQARGSTARRAVLVACMALVLHAFASSARAHARDYRDEMSLFGAASRALPRNAKVRYNYGNELVKAGKMEQGLVELEAAYNIHPRLYAYNMAILLARIGRQVDSINALKRCAGAPGDMAYRPGRGETPDAPKCALALAIHAVSGGADGIVTLSAAQSHAFAALRVSEDKAQHLLTREIMADPGLGALELTMRHQKRHGRPHSYSPAVLLSKDGSLRRRARRALGKRAWMAVNDAIKSASPAAPAASADKSGNDSGGNSIGKTRAALAAAPTSETRWTALSEALAHAGRPRHALAVLEAGLCVLPRSVAILMAVSQAHAAAGDAVRSAQVAMRLYLFARAQEASVVAGLPKQSEMYYQMRGWAVGTASQIHRALEPGGHPAAAKALALAARVVERTRVEQVFDAVLSRPSSSADKAKLRDLLSEALRNIG